jgi:hypothetical protein
LSSNFCEGARKCKVSPFFKLDPVCQAMNSHQPVKIQEYNPCPNNEEIDVSLKIPLVMK